MQHFHSIHYLRAVAALMVVVFHIHTGVDLMRADIEHIRWLRGGVDIFFVISGFVMVAATQGKATTPRAFFVRRCQRVIPLYWLATVIMMASLKGEFLFKLASMLFIPMVHPVSGALQPVVEPGWTLNYEMFFYLLFALSLSIREKWRFAALAGCLIALAALPLVIRPVGNLGFYTNTIMLEFLFGMAIAKFRLKGTVLLVPAGLLAMYILHPLTNYRILSLGIPAACVVIGAIGIEHKIRPNRALNLLGDASYAMYIFHIMALGLAIKYWPRLGLDDMLFAPVAVMFVILLAVALHLLLERPIIAYFARRNAQSRSRSANTEFSIFKRNASKAAFKAE